MPEHKVKNSTGGFKCLITVCLFQLSALCDESEGRYYQYGLLKHIVLTVRAETPPAASQKRAGRKGGGLSPSGDWSLATVCYVKLYFPTSWCLAAAGCWLSLGQIGCNEVYNAAAKDPYDCFGYHGHLKYVWKMGTCLQTLPNYSLMKLGRREMKTRIETTNVRTSGLCRTCLLNR